MEPDVLKLSELPRRLKAEFNVTISYRRLYRAVLDASIPAFKDESGVQWLIKSADLPLILEAMAHGPVRTHHG